ncbi:MAG: hypothetical protein ACTSPN_17020 [Promethearchaeota archaeon]
MEKIEHEKNGLIQSQQSLYQKFKRINRLFKIHFSSLISYFLTASILISIWMHNLITGRLSEHLYQIYGSFGIPWNIFLTSFVLISLIPILILIYIYSLFLIKGTRCLKQVKGIKESKNALYRGLVPYIKNFYTFFNRYSKKRTNLSMLVKTFLAINFGLGYLSFVILTRLLDFEIIKSFHILFMPTLFILMLASLIINSLTSISIGRSIVKWENLFVSLEEWGQELKDLSTNNFDNEES